MALSGSSFMRSTDAFTWHMERDPALRSTIVAVTWLSRSPDWDTLRARVDRMHRQVPGMWQRVAEPPLPLSTPRWVPDVHFDLDWHLRRIEAPAPHTRSAVLEIARRAAMDAFDKDRPLWEFTLVEGLTGGEAAFVLKLHHSLTDGVGGMRLLTVLFDLEADPGDLGEMPPLPELREAPGSRLAVEAVGSAVERTAHLAQRGLTGTLPTLWRVARHPVRTARDSTAMARSVYRTAGPMLDTRSPVMRDRAMTRHLSMREIPLTALKTAAASCGATLNDAFLAAVTGGLRRYHHRHDAPVAELRVTMPINLRAEDDAEFGNRITLQRVTLPVEEPDPARRMRLIHQAADSARHEPSLPVTDAIAEALNLLPPAYVGGVLKHIDFLASNVPGSPVPIWLAGAEVTGFFAFGPTIGASLNLTLISYQAVCDIAVNIDTAAVPDPAVLLECMDESFAEVLALGRAGQD